MAIWFFTVWACVATGKSDGSMDVEPDGPNASTDTSPSTDLPPVDSDTDTASTEDTSTETPSGVGAFEGAIVTDDCTYQDYPYAIDILLSCGSEQFDAELRLHTFKRHSHTHRQVFKDQRLTHRDGQLWFDDYAVPRCIRFTSDGRMVLASVSDQCSQVELDPQGTGFRLANPITGHCAGLGSANCNDHAFTGGRECGGTDHRYLPLVMGSCDAAVVFRVVTEAETCDTEYPESACF